MNKGTKILLVICIVTSLAGVGIIFDASAFQKKAKLTEGTVTDRRISSYHVLYTSDDGVQHNKYISQRSSNSFHDGDKVKVFYRADNPDIAQVGDAKKTGRTFVILGIIMFLIDVFMIYSNRKAVRIANYYKSNGRKVQAEITGIEVDYNITIGKSHPYTVGCKWSDPMTGRMYTQEITHVRNDPAPLLAGGKTIDVYIDRENPEKYFIDKDFLND